MSLTVQRLPIGRPVRRIAVGKTCPECMAGFKTKKLDQKYCSDVCARKLYRGKNRKLPSVEEVARLYFQDMKGTVEIGEIYKVSAQQVRLFLVRRGYKMRRKTSVTRCMVHGCIKPAFKIRHSINGSLYGKLCFYHRKRHRNFLSTNYTRKIRNIPTERWHYQIEDVNIAHRSQQTPLPAAQPVAKPVTPVALARSPQSDSTLPTRVGGKMTHPVMAGNVGAKLMRCRQAHNLTQAQLAEGADVPRTYISRIENGRLTPGPELLKKLADVMSGVSILDLLPADTYWENLRAGFGMLPLEKQRAVLENMRQIAA